LRSTNGTVMRSNPQFTTSICLRGDVDVWRWWWSTMHLRRSPLGYRKAKRMRVLGAVQLW